MENDAPVVGPDAPTANSKMVSPGQRSAAAAPWQAGEKDERACHLHRQVEIIHTERQQEPFGGCPVIE
jgi:hypothetical protein